MNKVIEQLMAHRTYRQFDSSYQLSSEQLEKILQAAKQAPTWMNGQFYSMIVIDEEIIRKQLVEWNPGNPHIAESSVFILFVADLYRTKVVANHYAVDYQITDNLDALLTATTDAALACENAVIAAESMGLGAVVVGSIRSHGEKIISLLELQSYTFPLFGLSIGKPNVEMKVKPRLPEELVIHKNKYQPIDYKLIQEYDDKMQKFGEARETKKWTQKFADYFSSQKPEVTNSNLKKQKFIK